MQDLKQRSALVTGASAGIGRAIATRLSQAGAHVVLAARRKERLEALQAELPGSEVMQLDVRDRKGVEAALSGRKFDIAVLNAGMARGVAAIQDGKLEDWDEMLDTNVRGLLAVLRTVLPGMLERESGDLLLLGSVAGRQVYPGGNIYCATKHAVRAIYEALRLDAGGKGVRFTTIDPGIVETEFSEVRFSGDREAAAAVYSDLRSLQPGDVADAALFALTRPAHVNIGEIVLWPTDQGSTRDVHRGRA